MEFWLITNLIVFEKVNNFKTVYHFFDGEIKIKLEKMENNFFPQKFSFYFI